MTAAEPDPEAGCPSFQGGQGPQPKTPLCFSLPKDSLSAVHPCGLCLAESEETLLVWMDVESWKKSEKGESL